MINIIESDYQKILKIWDYKKNDFPPVKERLKPREEYWWICKQKHSYKISIAHKLNRNIESCPVCSGKRIVIGTNDLATTHPTIASQWDYTKNSRTPEQVTFGSSQKVWWLCEIYQHSTESSVSSKTKNNNCSICTNRQVLKGFNDLSTVLPELAKTVSKKSLIKPDTVTIGSTKKLLWICLKEHEFEASVSNRVKKRGCPYCAGKKILPGFNDLQTLYPLLAKEFDKEKNKVHPFYFLPAQTKKAWWICSNYKHSYYSNIGSRIKGTGCSYCSNKKVLKNFNDLKTTNSEIAKELFVERSGFSADEITAGSNKKAWWKCTSYQHEWQATVADRTNGYGCPYCSNQKTLQGFNDFASSYPLLLKEWSKNKNVLQPHEINKGYDKKVWWECKNGHSWDVPIKERLRGYNCRYCFGNFVMKGETDLATTHKDMLKEWDYTRNTISPTEVSFGSGKNVWWICAKGHRWKATIKNRVRLKHSCPKCSLSSVSKAELTLVEYVFSIIGEENVVTNTRQVIKPYELDIYLPSLNKAIEFNGNYWHSDEQIQKHKGISAEEYHKRKFDLCEKEGVQLAFVWEFDWNNNKNNIEKCINNFLLNNILETSLKKLASSVSSIQPGDAVALPKPQEYDWTTF